MMITTSGKKKSQAGFSLIELLLAMFVMAVGLSAIAILFTTAIASNKRNKVNTTSTMLAQTVLDQIAAKAANDAANITITDCAGTANTIATASGASPNGAGATLVAADGPGGYPRAGDIDYTQAYAAIAANYKMTYVDCGSNGGAAGTRTSYEVRWNVMAMPAAMGAKTATFVKVVTVTARQKNSGSNLSFFARPATLRTITGGNN
jgi:prepilin-type N-terminal cleavage/methylation domain-containing protein